MCYRIRQLIWWGRNFTDGRYLISHYLVILIQFSQNGKCVYLLCPGLTLNHRSPKVPNSILKVLQFCHPSTLYCKKCKTKVDHKVIKGNLIVAADNYVGFIAPYRFLQPWQFSSYSWTTWNPISAMCCTLTSGRRTPTCLPRPTWQRRITLARKGLTSPYPNWPWRIQRGNCKCFK